MNRFLSQLGFDKTDSMNMSDFKEASLVHDLNDPILESLKRTYDFIYDGSTLEHVFNIAEVMKTLSGIVRKGGIIVYWNPINEMVNHDFWQSSPAFFLSYYAKNGFKVKAFYMFHQKKKSPVNLFGAFKDPDRGVLNTAIRIVIKSTSDPAEMISSLTISEKIAEIALSNAIHLFYNSKYPKNGRFSQFKNAKILKQKYNWHLGGDEHN